MGKKFNITGICIPKFHYMVNTEKKIKSIISKYIECGEYFTINRARQYGKSTTLELLYNALKDKYIVIDISFEAADDCFVSMHTLAQGFVNKVARSLMSYDIPKEILQEWKQPISEILPLDLLSERISEFCRKSEKEVILLVDEVDKAADNQIFLSFLGLLREKYLRSRTGKDYTFKSVILAGVYDIKNLKMKMNPEQKVHYNSPWNIAADFDMDMSFSAKDIETMLVDYEEEHETGMNISLVAKWLYDYTKGYPYLVSFVCKIIDEQLVGTKQYKTVQEAWSKKGLSDAVKYLLKSENTLFDDMIKQLQDYPELSKMLQNILFSGQYYPYNPYNQEIGIGIMFGFVTEEDGKAVVANRIFETHLYNYFLSEELSKNTIRRIQSPSKNQYIKNGQLDMEFIFEKFVQYFADLYNVNDVQFVEEYGRKLFLLYIKPIINGTGNYYIEAQTRDSKRTDVIIDYLGQQYIIEMKIWHGKEYNSRGEQQLLEYLEAYHLDKGYMLSFNFNKKKEVGVKNIQIGDKVLVEAVV